MNPSAQNSLYKDYLVIKSLVKNELNEIILANRIADDRKVIIKKSDSSKTDFLRISQLGHEYHILKGLSHKGLPLVFDFLYDGKSAALVQGYVEGMDLRNVIFKNKLTYNEVLDFAIQLADILHYLHLQGVIHKDINPGNVMVSRDGSLKLLDFGISSNLHSEKKEILNIDRIEGTLNYISPEQTGRTAYSVTHSSDFYSMGILLYELLAGKTPFDSIDPLEVIHFHLSRKPLPLASALPDLPKGFDQVVAKLLEKNPDERYQSAAGLKADLQILKKHYNSKEPLIDFKAGAADISEQYQQSQKLYGRENEIKELLGHYDRLQQVKSMLVLVAGYSGVGKSALIRHIKFPIIQNRGTFISGKFDQFNKEIPYSAFIEAIREFIQNLLAEPEEKIREWKQRISQVLGENAALIIEVIPQLARIIDKQPPVVKLQPAEQESRFNMVLLDFIYIFSTAESPLVIFLDDLQWADLPSLNLVKRIIENPRRDSILIMGSYRDNEVEQGHPLLITLNQISEVNGFVKSIYLRPLNLETTIQIAADSFGMKKDQAEELGQQVFTKTKGNPFFIHSFLKSLFDKKLVKKDPEKNWVWDQMEINNLGYTDNVIDLMTEGLAELPTFTREVLQYAAVLGNTFNFSDLSNMIGKSEVKVFADLKPAIKGGFINSTDTNYRALALKSLQVENEIENNLEYKNFQFKFTHDKVQQAAYNLISASERIFLHLKIGRLLLQSRDRTQLNDDIFEVMNHFVLSAHLIESRDEKLKIAELCWVAGKKAKDSTSYNLAVNFLSLAKNLLGSDAWSENHALTYNVWIELGECEYLNNNPDQAEVYFREILRKSKTNFEKLKVYYIHSSLYLKIGNTSESLRLGLEAAKLYNIHFPKNKKAIQIQAMVTMAKYLFLFSTKYKNPESLFHLKECTDEEIIALNKFLIDLATSAYQQDQNLMMLVIFKIIKYYIKMGFTDASGWGFSGFSVVVLSALKMQKKGFNLWDITIKLHHRTKSPLIKWRLNYTVLCFHNHWRRPIREGHNSIMETIKACVLNGDQIFTSYTIALYTRSMVAAGENLKEILDKSEDHKNLIKHVKGGLDFFECFYQFAKAMNGQTYADSWDDDSFSGAETLNRLQNEGNKTKLSFFHSAHCTLLYCQGKYREALAESQVVAEYADNFLGDLQEFSHAFYTALSIAACYEELDEVEQKQQLKVFKKYLKDMKHWETGCPENFGQHAQLLEAEGYAMANQFGKAQLSYERSIQMAAQNKFTHVEAIANERAAILAAKNQMGKQSRNYMEEAWDVYARWGAHAKCLQLEVSYPELLKSRSLPEELEGRAIGFQTTGSSSKTALDLASVLKASQSIASQVKYEDLLKKLMHITIENAGAERGCLLRIKDNRLCVEAIGISGSERIDILPSVPLSELKTLPESILNYCWRTEENIVVDDALREPRFGSDVYIQENKLSSVMCLPIFAVGKMIGMLYFENTLIKGVFNKNRIEILKMLLGQIGISIENAILYGNLEEKVLERTKEIEKAYADLKSAQSKLIQSEKMASLGELTAGIAHEIQNPLNFVNNFSEVSAELAEEMNEEIDKGKWAEAKEIAIDLIQNLKKINHHGNRAGAIVKGMLEHSRTRTGEKVLTDINALADEYLRLAYHGLLAKDKSVQLNFQTDFDPSLPKIKVVPQDFGRLLLNIINNAFYACGQKSPTEIAVGESLILPATEASKPMVTVSTKNLGNTIRIAISDNGPGIPEDIKDKIFQPFFTTKPTGQGTGLGLSLSYDIVKAQGGDLKVESTFGKGSTFIIDLPVR
ncbi:ATP-binding sensor histidine kinase [Rhodonellum sp.]|uniref:ATP-binding sensor histidine kinase n=1 Tax=Rhodonellum sp. TaxID=2231180 RepID=UPI0027167099|nr:ATP-binding sensor histidine kinase [Rhodonellum sp.]MDO9553376.1 AAA family ATPase [Rhodonellum sp.]